MDAGLDANMLLLSTATFAGVVVGLVAFLIVRHGARHAFGQELVRDRPAPGGPFRGGMLERLVARDAPLALRIAGAFALGIACAELLVHLQLASITRDAVARAVTRAHRAELGPAADLSAARALLWASRALPATSAFASAALVPAILTLLSAPLLAVAAIQQLRRRPMPHGVLVTIALTTALACAADGWRGLDPPPREIIGLEAIPTFYPLFLAPFSLLSAYLLVRSRALTPKEPETSP
jgi:hypothetical protein